MSRRIFFVALVMYSNGTTVQLSNASLTRCNWMIAPRLLHFGRKFLVKRLNLHLNAINKNIFKNEKK